MWANYLEKGIFNTSILKIKNKQMHLEPKRRKQTKNIKKTPKTGCNKVGRNQVWGSPKKCSENKKGQKNQFWGVYP